MKASPCHWADVTAERDVAHVVALASGVMQRVIGTANKAVAALFVRKASLQAHCSVELIAKVYKLTRSETRVLLAIIEVGGVPETADVPSASVKLTDKNASLSYLLKDGCEPSGGPCKTCGKVFRSVDEQSDHVSLSRRRHII